MIGRVYENRRYWTQALVVSLALHGVAAAAVMDVLPSLPRPTNNAPLPEIDVTSLEMDQGVVTTSNIQPVTPLTPDPVLPGTEQQATAAGDPMQPETISPVTPPDDMLGAITGTVDPLNGTGSATTEGDQIIAALPPSSSVGIVPQGGTQSEATGARNAALADLIGQLRNRLAAPCLAALPQTLGGEEVQLTVLGAQDRDIADLFRDVAGSVDVPMTERSVLLDARQCPAVDFARAAPSYPAWPLRMQLDMAEITSGDRLTGRVEGIRDNQATLLLVDDNGVVQDLRRFTLLTEGRLEFDVPIHRVGAARDTSQLLLAIATPNQPEIVDRLAGQLAEDFFAPLSQAVGSSGPLIGITTVYVRGAAE